MESRINMVSRCSVVQLNIIFNEKPINVKINIRFHFLELGWNE